ncbi:MAG: M42 family metallopeptidase [Clostridia bacterium]|nr:M42 family metallopeptidase [Clostridia bacterium]
MEGLLEKLCTLRGVSGFETMGSHALGDLFRAKLEGVWEDRLGNVFGYIRCGKPNAPCILLEAHYDMIGLIVNQIDDSGFVTFVSSGGVDPRILPGSEVTICGREQVYGVIGMKPPHILSAEEQKKAMKITDLAIDTGFSKEQLAEKIQVGDPVTLTGSLIYMHDMVCSRSLDDRAGLASLFLAAEQLKRSRLQVDICIQAAVCEETGQQGARCGAFAVNPDLAIVVDVTHGTTPDGKKDRTSPVGEGTVVCLGPNIHRKHAKQLLAVLEKQHIPYHIEVEEGNTGTDAWVVQVVRSGIPCLLLSIPLKYMHTTIETIAKNDIQSTADAIAAYVKFISEQGVLRQ